MKKPTSFILKSRVDLKQLLLHHRIQALPHQGKISLRIEGLSINEKDSWERRLNRYFFDCGCGLGAIALIAVIGIYFFYLLFRTGGLLSFSWIDIIYGLLIFILSSGIGKSLGIIRAKFLLKKTIDSLSRRLTHADPEKELACHSSPVID